MFCRNFPLISCFSSSRDSFNDELVPLKLDNREPVFVNVYDMYGINDYTSPIGLGVFHSGIEIYGTEYAFGGHCYPVTGIFEIAPRNVNSDLDDNFHFRESIKLGYTQLSAGDVERLVDEMGRQFRGDCYHLTSNNCNHFTNAFARKLCGVEIPGWINRLANIIAYVPFLQRCLPLEWLTPTFSGDEPPHTFP